MQHKPQKVYNINMDKKPQPKVQAKSDNGMTKKEALDILLRNVAEGKKDIAQGLHYTPEQAFAIYQNYRANRNFTRC